MSDAAGQATGGACGNDKPFTAYEYDQNGNRTKHTSYPSASGSAPAQTKVTHTTYDDDDRPLAESATRWRSGDDDLQIRRHREPPRTDHW
ncbi:hypothetical protein [Actinomadura sp. 6N118]|uniref:hypothetical protein n=1 Tax=Actinomadura sp. 6N118 TaxID=3375151 RepID=UPI0037B45272